MRRVPLLPVLLLAACGLNVNSNSISVPYTLDPEEFRHDVGADFQNQSGKFPSVPCTNDMMCSAFSPLPGGATVTCNAGTCVAAYDLRVPVPVKLVDQSRFPQEVTSSSVINDVQVQSVSYWAAMNSLNIDTPAIDLYVGAQGIAKETDAGVSKLGTLPPIAHGGANMGLTACGTGAPGTADSACDLPLTDAGKRALATLARSFRSPFTVLLVGHLQLHGGDPVPNGALDLFLRPTLAFVIPL